MDALTEKEHCTRAALVVIFGLESVVQEEFSTEDIRNLAAYGCASVRTLKTATVADLEQAGLSKGLAKMLFVAAESAAPSAAPLGAETLVGIAGEGINNYGRSIDRAATCNVIMARCALFGFQILKGPPRSGKTALLQLLVRMVTRRQLPHYSEALYINMARMGEDDTWEEFFGRETGGRDWRQFARPSDDGGASGFGQLALLCIDEMQAVYASAARIQPLCRYLKTLLSAVKGRLRVVMACIHGDSPSHDTSESLFTSTPFDYSPANLVGLLPCSPGSCSSSMAVAAAKAPAIAAADMAAAAAAAEAVAAFEAGDEQRKQEAAAALAATAPGLMLTEREYDELWECLWADHPHYKRLFVMTSDNCKLDIYRRTAGQVGMVTAIAEALRRDVHDRTSRGQRADGAGDAAYLTMIRSGGIFSAIKGQRAFIVEALVPGSPRMRLLERLLASSTGEALVSSLTEEEREELRRLQHRGRLCVANDQYSFWTPLHHDYYRDKVYHGHLHSLDTAAESLRHFIMNCVRRMSQSRLHETLCRTHDGEYVLERMLQMEFYRICASLLPPGHRADPDVNQGGRGWVDFWLWPNNWAIELLCNGADMAEHERRFLPPGGKYSLWPITEYAVLDFRAAGTPRPRPRAAGDNSWHVLFSHDYSTATIQQAVTQEVVETVALAS